MNADRLALLRQEMNNLEAAADLLRFSLRRTGKLIQRTAWSPQELERLESLTSRFARLADLLIQRVMRLVDEIELIGGGAILDRIHRAEKRGWIDSGSTLVRIRELRNLIAHEYAADKMAEIYRAVAKFSPALLDVVPAVVQYARALLQQGEGK